jgi:hypothetical protein
MAYLRACTHLDGDRFERAGLLTRDKVRPLAKPLLGYFSCVEIELKVDLSFVPRPLTTAMIATEIPAAIRPYSMAVAAESSLRNALNLLLMATS